MWVKINERAAALTQLLQNELTKRRTEAGLSKNETATRAGLSVSFVSDLEHGKRRPTVETLARLSWVLGTTPSELISSCEKQLQEE